MGESRRWKIKYLKTIDKKQLQSRCREKGLPAYGTKEQLAERIVDHNEKNE